jgi:hypothetical protein
MGCRTGYQHKIPPDTQFFVAIRRKAGVALDDASASFGE